MYIAINVYNCNISIVVHPEMNNKVNMEAPKVIKNPERM